MIKLNYIKRYEIFNLYQNDYSINEIAIKLNISKPTVRKYLTLSKILKNKKCKKPYFLKKVISLIRKNKISIKAIAEELSVDYHIIYYLKQKHLKYYIKSINHLNEFQKLKIDNYKKNGLNCSDIAKKLNVHKSTISRYLNKKRT